METNAERRTRKLRELAARTPGGLRAVAESANVSVESLDQIIKGVLLPAKRDGTRSARRLGDGTADRIQEALGLPRGWFDTEDLLPQIVEPPNPGRGLEAGSFDVPLLANAGSMGPGLDVHDDVVVGKLTLSPSWIANRLKPLTNPQNLRFIHGYGDSMEPTFCDGDILLVDAGITTAQIDGVYVLEANNRVYIKRVRQTLGGEFQVSSDNATVKTIDVLDGSRQVKVLGKVIWLWNGKKI